jgi:hypothetical protein
MKYTSLTDAQKLALNSEEFLIAVKLEGIDRGIKPPLTLENALRQSEMQGFSMPPDAVFFYEIIAPKSYSAERTGVCFKTIEEAQRAIQGAFGIYQDGYGATASDRLADASGFQIRQVWISHTKPKQYWTKLEEFMQDDKEFEALCDECRNDLQALRQREYDKAVALRKRAEYMALAKGSAEIAAAFWAKTERTEFPTEAAA